jgi:hypothetical protein
MTKLLFRYLPRFARWLHRREQVCIVCDAVIVLRGPLGKKGRSHGLCKTCSKQERAQLVSAVRNAVEPKQCHFCRDQRFISIVGDGERPCPFCRPMAYIISDLSPSR